MAYHVNNVVYGNDEIVIILQRNNQEPVIQLNSGSDIDIVVLGASGRPAEK